MTITTDTLRIDFALVTDRYGRECFEIESVLTSECGPIDLTPTLLDEIEQIIEDEVQAARYDEMMADCEHAALAHLYL